jgi:DNA-binding Lrp family transcriptional regulator
MVRAFVLIGMEAGHSRNLVTSLEGQPGVYAVDRVTGPYDVIAVLEAENINAISDIVATEIHSLSGVVRTTTCVSME